MGGAKVISYSLATEVIREAGVTDLKPGRLGTVLALGNIAGRVSGGKRMMILVLNMLT